MDISKELKNLLVGFVMGMSHADKEMLFGNSNKVPEMASISTPQAVSKNTEFLAAIQNGQLSEQQLKWFYKVLDKMDDFHRNGGAMGNSGILSEQKQFKKVDDFTPGFSVEKTFTNKTIENHLGGSPIPTLSILRDSAPRGVAKIEDYCTELVIKTNGNKFLAEFYCNDYKNEGGNLQEQVSKTLNSYNLSNFTNIQAFNAVRSTATRNGVDHAYRVNSFHSWKTLDKGFVVKFLVEEL